MQDDYNRMSRLSGEASSRHYIKVREKPGPVTGRQVYQPFTTARPRRKSTGWYKPVLKTIPFVPYNHKGVFGRRFPSVPMGPYVGLAAKGARLMPRLNPWLTTLDLAITLLNAQYWGAMKTMRHYDPQRYGWRQSCFAGTPPGTGYTSGTGYRSTTSNPNLACGVVGQVPDHLGVTSIPANRVWFAMGPTTAPAPPVKRMALETQYVRPGGGLAMPPLAQPAPGSWGLPYAVPVPYPALDPLSMPIGQPVPTPRPIPWRVLPYRRPSPWRAPSEQPYTYSPPSPTYRPAPSPSAEPSLEVVIQPGAVSPPRGSWHIRRPPTRGEKEKKFIMSIAGASQLGRMLSMITESLDLLNAAYKALPDDVRKKGYATPQEKLSLILNNLDKFRPGTFVAEYLSNQLEDTAFARFSKIGAKAQREAANRFGVAPRPELGEGTSPAGPSVNNGWVDAWDAQLEELLRDW